MRETKAERLARLYASLGELGFSYAEASALRRIERTLQRWGELECGDSNDWNSWAIERDETTGKPYLCTYPHSGKASRVPVADREAGAKRRLARLLTEHPGLVAYHQPDCRGCALYILRAEQIGPGESIDSIYTRGVAVCY